jgi:hypothetical protein
MARPKPDQVAGVLQQQPAVAAADLVLDPPDPAGQDRAGFPHRLGHRQPEPLGKALLHDHVGAALHGVDHGRVLLQVLHRQTRQMHPVTRGARQRRLGSAHLLEDLLALGVVAHRLDRRAGQDQAGAQPVGDVGR